MINNRQGGRRRGRGGQRGPNVSGGQPGNRQDNRQRGNAAQLLEKYKSMARDSQLAGDRVQTEYYLQYADHYFRVLGESQSRFETQRRQRGDDMDDDEGDDEHLEAGDHDSGGGDDDERAQREEPAQCDDRPPRDDRDQRDDRPQRAERPQREDRPQRADRPERAERLDRPERVERRPQRDRPRRAAPNDEQGSGESRGTDERMNGGETIPFDALPPAIGLDAGEDDGPAPEAEARPARKTRTRAPRRDDGDVAPTA